MITLAPSRIISSKYPSEEEIASCLSFHDITTSIFCVREIVYASRCSPKSKISLEPFLISSFFHSPLFDLLQHWSVYHSYKSMIISIDSENWENRDIDIWNAPAHFPTRTRDAQSQILGVKRVRTRTNWTNWANNALATHDKMLSRKWLKTHPPYLTTWNLLTKSVRFLMCYAYSCTPLAKVLLVISTM